MAGRLRRCDRRQIGHSGRFVRPPDRSDADGDVVPFTYTWQVGQKVKLVVGPTSASSSRFDLRELQPGDVVTVTVTPASDGFDPGVPSSATAVVRSPK